MSNLETIEAFCPPGVESSTPPPDQDQDQVALYLENHPNFFQNHEHLLAALNFPQSSGGTVSLAARQAEILRDKMRVNEKKLHDLHSQALANEQRAQRLHRIALTLIRSSQPHVMLHDVCAQLSQEFDLAGALINLESNALGEESSNKPELVTFIRDDAGWKHLAKLATPIIPRMNNELRELMVKHGFPETGSVAAIPLWTRSAEGTRDTSMSGTLLLVKREPHGFSPDMGILFLEQIGELVSAALSRQQQALTN